MKIPRLFIRKDEIDLKYEKNLVPYDIKTNIISALHFEYQISYFINFLKHIEIFVVGVFLNDNN